MTDSFINERYELCMGRIEEIAVEDVLQEPLNSYFKDIASFLIVLKDVISKSETGKLRQLSLEELQKLNAKLYEAVLPENYDECWGNPDYITGVFEKYSLPKSYSRCLCFLYAEVRGMIPYAFEVKKEIVTLYVELFIEIYGLFTNALYELGKPTDEEISGGIVQEVDCQIDGCIAMPDDRILKEALISFENDNSEIIVPDRINDQINPERDFALSIVKNSDLEDLRYLYFFGEYISKDEIKIAEYLNSLPEEDIAKMADTYTEGYRIGFVKDKKPLDKKITVDIRYPIGFERMIRRAVLNFEAMGLKATMYHPASVSLNRNNHFRIGYTGAIANRQYEYDHQDDRALFLDQDHINRRLSILKNAFEDNITLANGHAGPAVVETFGEDPFVPVPKKNAIKLSDEQQPLASTFAVESANITTKYIKGEERSFTIIAFPVPSIGDEFENIFRETVRLNTLDYKLYEGLQQIIIDALDKADRVHVVGKDGNETDLWIELYKLDDPDGQTKFENCVADVNIPVGEVFTTPVLKGTNGLLHVSQVYLEGLLFKNLKVYLKDGCVAKYSCANFVSASENEKYFKENVLFNHETLPIGEFAIGTNTTAYTMARQYGIEERLPILIGEKTGPHFALGDTCYSRQEGVKVYNPDGKEIISRENDFSRLREKDPSKAYFSCHTDITIPYDELGGIYAVTPDGEIKIIENGLFVLDGLDELNRPLAK